MIGEESQSPTQGKCIETKPPILNKRETML